MNRAAYPSDVSDEEWTLVAPYLTLMTEDAPQREHPLREVFNGLRHIVRTGAAWRLMPYDLPPWYTVYQQTQRWLAAGVLKELVMTPPKLPLNTALIWSWSSCPKLSAALFSCPNAGSWNVLLPGPHVSGVLPEIMNDCPRRWRACILSPLPCSCRYASFIY